MNQLRQELESSRDKFAVYMKRRMGGRQIGGSELNEHEVIDAILDTLLSALPEDNKPTVINSYNVAIRDVKQLLLNAKEDK